LVAPVGANTHAAGSVDASQVQAMIA